MKTYDLTYISLGAGIQSTALLVCSALGLRGVPKADCAIFADTGDEIEDTYRHLDFLTKWAGKRGIPVHRVQFAHLGAELTGEKQKARRDFIVSIPAFTKNGGLLRRQCTSEFKIVPIQNKVREMLGFQKGERIAGKKLARALIGISSDEAQRMRDSRVKWIENCYPLAMNGISRWDCERILAENKIPVPVKSACRFCPYHDDRYWNWLKTERPDEFQKAVKVDKGIRDLTRAGVKEPTFLHRSRKPLDEVEFDKREDSNQLDMFGNECEGMCGV